MMVVLLPGLVSCPGGDSNIGDPRPEQYSCDVQLDSNLLSENAPSYADWLQQTTRTMPDGTWVFEGDIAISDEDILRGFYRERFLRADLEPSLRFRSTLACSNGRDVAWSFEQKLNITYCIGEFTTPGLREKVISDLASAARAWEQAADINFIQVDIPVEDCNCIINGVENLGEDEFNCPSFTNRARYRVREMKDAEMNTGLAALASYPGSLPSQVLVHPSADQLLNPLNLRRLLTHELGHTLGFRHEHARFIQAMFQEGLFACDESSSWRTVTDPDSKSIMGYGACAGTEGLIFSSDVISALDRQGASYIYDISRNSAPSFSNSDVDDILWLSPRRGVFTLWRATPNPNGEIVFSDDFVTEFCAIDDPNNPGACLSRTSFAVPVPASLTDPQLTDVLYYALGHITVVEDDEDVLIDLPDSLLLHSANGPLTQSPALNTAHTFDLPIIGQFHLNDQNERIWWVRPGTESDPLGNLGNEGYSVNAGDDFGLGDTRNLYYRPVVGHWDHIGSDRPLSQVLWYREGSNSLRLSYQSADGLTMEHKLLSPSCLFSSLGDSTPLRGDFDGDGELEIFWVAYRTGQNVLWRDTFTLWNSGIGGDKCGDTDLVKTIAPHGQQEILAKAAVGDFDGDGTDDIFWYGAPGGDEVWLRVGTDDGPVIVSPRTGSTTQRAGDRSPLVGDYNGDKCDDILWFSPHTEWRAVSKMGELISYTEGESPLWRSLCNADDEFVYFSKSTVETPETSAPVGYDPRSGVRF